MSFFGDLHRTGAGKEIQRSANVIQDTLIDKPRRRARVDKLEKERAEDRLVQKELQVMNLAEARSKFGQLKRRESILDLNLANQKLKAQGIADEYKRANSVIDFKDELRRMTATAAGFDELYGTGVGMGLIDPSGKGPRKNMDLLIKHYRENPEANEKLAYGSIGAHEKRIQEIESLIRYGTLGGKNFPGGTEAYNKLVEETAISYKYKNIIDPDHKGPIPISDLKKILENEKKIKAKLENSTALKAKEKLTLYKYNLDGSESEVNVYRGTENHQQKLNEGYRSERKRNRPDNLANARKNREEERKIKAAITKNSKEIFELQEKRDMLAQEDWPKYNALISNIRKQNEGLERQLKVAPVRRRPVVQDPGTATTPGAVTGQPQPVITPSAGELPSIFLPDGKINPAYVIEAKKAGHSIEQIQKDAGKTKPVARPEVLPPSKTGKKAETVKPKVRTRPTLAQATKDITTPEAGMADVDAPAGKDFTGGLAKKAISEYGEIITDYKEYRKKKVEWNKKVENATQEEMKELAKTMPINSIEGKAWLKDKYDEWQKGLMTDSEFVNQLKHGRRKPEVVRGKVPLRPGEVYKGGGKEVRKKISRGKVVTKKVPPRRRKP